MNTQRWNREKQRRIKDWEETIRPWVSEALNLGMGLREVMAHVREEMVRQAKVRWTVSEAAKQLGITRQGLTYEPKGGE